MAKRIKTFGKPGGSVIIVPAHDRSLAWNPTSKTGKYGERYSKRGIDKASKLWRKKRKRRGRRKTKSGIILGGY